jgi:hypothetical protein
MKPTLLTAGGLAVAVSLGALVVSRTSKKFD